MILLVVSFSYSHRSIFHLKYFSDLAGVCDLFCTFKSGLLTMPLQVFVSSKLSYSLLSPNIYPTTSDIPPPPTRTSHTYQSHTSNRSTSKPPSTDKNLSTRCSTCRCPLFCCTSSRFLNLITVGCSYVTEPSQSLIV